MLFTDWIPYHTPVNWNVRETKSKSKTEKLKFVSLTHSFWRLGNFKIRVRSLDSLKKNVMSLSWLLFFLYKFDSRIDREYRNWRIKFEKEMKTNIGRTIRCSHWNKYYPIHVEQWHWSHLRTVNAIELCIHATAHENWQQYEFQHFSLSSKFETEQNTNTKFEISVETQNASNSLRCKIK